MKAETFKENLEWLSIKRLWGFVVCSFTMMFAFLIGSVTVVWSLSAGKVAKKTPRRLVSSVDSEQQLLRLALSSYLISDI
jgi:hypothetical protein